MATKETQERKILPGVVNVLIAIILLLVIALITGECSGTQEPKMVYEYVTDTIEVKSEYKGRYEKLLKQFEKEKLTTTPPKKVIEYLPSKLEYIEIEKIPDSILVLVDSLKGEIHRLVISDNYIKNFPENDKLITFSLTEKDLDITTVDIKGDIREKNYPLYLDRYEYIWLDNELKHNTRENQKKPNKQPFSETYINAGYEFIGKVPTLSIEQDFNISRFKLGIDANVLLRQSDNIYLGAKLGYRLF